MCIEIWASMSRNLYIAFRLSLSCFIYPSSYFVNSSNLHPLRSGSSQCSHPLAAGALHCRLPDALCSASVVTRPSTRTLLTSDHEPLTTAPCGHWVASWCWGSACAWPRHLEAGVRARTMGTRGPSRPASTLTRCLDTTPSSSPTTDSTTGQFWSTDGFWRY